MDAALPFEFGPVEHHAQGLPQRRVGIARPLQSFEAIFARFSMEREGHPIYVLSFRWKPSGADAEREWTIAAHPVPLETVNHFPMGLRRMGSVGLGGAIEIVLGSEGWFSASGYLVGEVTSQHSRIGEGSEG